MRQARGKASLRRILALALVCATVLGLSAGRSEAAVAMGPYLDLSSGSGEFEWDSDINDFDVDSSSAGARIHPAGRQCCGSSPKSRPFRGERGRPAGKLKCRP